MHLNTLTLLDWQEGPDSDNVRTFVECKQPESVDQAAEYANLHFQLLQIGKETRGNVAVTQRPPGILPVRYNGPPHYANSNFKGPAFNAPRQTGRQDYNCRGARTSLMASGRGQIYWAQGGAEYN